MTNWDLNATELVKSVIESDKESCNSDDDDDENDNECEKETIMSISDFTEFIERAKKFSKHYGKTTLLGTVMDLEDQFTNEFLMKAPRQTRIMDFFG